MIKVGKVTELNIWVHISYTWRRIFFKMLVVGFNHSLPILPEQFKNFWVRHILVKKSWSPGLQLWFLRRLICLIFMEMSKHPPWCSAVVSAYPTLVEWNQFELKCFIGLRCIPAVEEAAFSSPFELFLFSHQTGRLALPHECSPKWRFILETVMSP